MKIQPLLVIALFFATWICQGCEGPVEFVRNPEDVKGKGQVLLVPEDMARRRADSLQLGPTLGRIAIVSHSTLNIDYINIAIDNHQRYAKKFAYDYIFRNNVITERYLDPFGGKKVFQLGLYWQKIQAVKEALDEGYEWVMWVDPDVLFTNFDRKIEDVLGEHRHNNQQFLISEENFCRLNTGIFLVHQSPWSHQMLEHIATLHPHYKNDLLPEQLAVQDFSLGYTHLSSRKGWSFTPDNKRTYSNNPIPEVAILPQRVLNSFYLGKWWLPGSTSESALWQPGDFVAHYATRFDRKKPEMQALADCFVSRCGNDYENNNACVRECS